MRRTPTDVVNRCRNRDGDSATLAATASSDTASASASLFGMLQAAPPIAGTPRAGYSLDSSENPRLSLFIKARSDGVAPSMRRNVRVR